MDEICWVGGRVRVVRVMRMVFGIAVEISRFGDRSRGVTGLLLPCAWLRYAGFRTRVLGAR